MKTSSCKKFTLIEMLVVIAIISILAGLVFPALGLARQNAKKSKANSECQSLKAAIIMYESEFSTWPAKVGNDGRVSDSDFVDMCNFLICPDPNDNRKKNGKNMVFYEAGMGYDDRKGLLDPWGNKYQVILDTDFDGKIKNDGDAKDISTSTQSYLQTRVIVFSYGVDRTKDKTSLDKLAKNKKVVVAM